MKRLEQLRAVVSCSSLCPRWNIAKAEELFADTQAAEARALVRRPLLPGSLPHGFSSGPGLCQLQHPRSPTECEAVAQQKQVSLEAPFWVPCCLVSLLGYSQELNLLVQIGGNSTSCGAGGRQPHPASGPGGAAPSGDDVFKVTGPGPKDDLPLPFSLLRTRGCTWRAQPGPMGSPSPTSSPWQLSQSRESVLTGTGRRL